MVQQSATATSEPAAARPLERAATARAARSGPARSFSAAEAAACARAHGELVRMLGVLDRMGARPGPSRRLAGDWIGTLAEWMDRPDPVTRVAPPRPSAAEISAADAAFEVLQSLRRVDEFGAFVVAARAARVPWRRIAGLDPQRRRRRALAYLRLAMLARMLRIARSDPPRFKNFLDRVHKKT